MTSRVPTLTTAISPCPNDTFIFHALATGRLRLPHHQLSFTFEDVETLNQAALTGMYDITKLSFHAYLRAKRHYHLLRTGAALGYGCGPILVAKQPIAADALAPLRILVPGALTTAHLLLTLYCPSLTHKQFVRYDHIIPMLEAGKADAGVIIHEDRFVFEKLGLHQVVDLGAFWEETTHAPIPLGCVAIRRELAHTLAEPIENLMRQSINMARTDLSTALPFIRTHAQQMDSDILEKHIAMFVNAHSFDLGADGDKAVEALESLAKKAGIMP